MKTGFERRLLVVWLALSAITLAQLGVGSADGQTGLTPNAAITASAIGIARGGLDDAVERFGSQNDAYLGTEAKPVVNGESFQAYSATANPGCKMAADATKGVVATWGGELIVANY